jgi:outer membrane protein TolC
MRHEGNGMWTAYRHRKQQARLAMPVLALVLSASCAGAGAQGLRLADAVQLALSQNADIEVQRTQIEAALGQQQQAGGRFDWMVSSKLNYERAITPLTDSARILGGNGLIDQARVFSTGYSLQGSKQLRNGMAISAGFDAAGTQDSGSEQGPAQQNLARLNVALRVPLLQGGGRAVTAAEDAAALTAQARRYELLDRAARTLYSTLVAYWNCRTQIALEKVAASAEERSTSLLESIQKLVAAAQKPAADLVLAKADHADKLVTREAAALARSDARQALGRLLGLDALAIAALPDPVENMPDVGAMPAVRPASLEALRNQALARRPDVRALALQLEAAQRALDGARDQLKPRLDLNMGVAYSKASEGGRHYSLFEPGRVQSAPSVFARLEFDFPVANNQAKGALRERSAQLSQMAIQHRDLAIAVTSGVDRALHALASSAAQLDAGRAGLALYDQAVKQEIVKQRNGLSTLIDVINTEARFVNAQVNLLQSQLAYATALARLRLETGTLVPAQAGERFILDASDLGGLGPLSGSFVSAAASVRASGT